MAGLTFEDLPRAVEGLQQSVDELKRLLLDKEPYGQESVLPESDKLLTLKQIAEFLNTSPGAVYQLVHKRNLPFSKRGKLYFSEKELRHWIQSGWRQTIEEIQTESLKSLSSDNPRRRKQTL